MCARNDCLIHDWKGETGDSGNRQEHETEYRSVKIGNRLAIKEMSTIEEKETSCGGLPAVPRGVVTTRAGSTVMSWRNWLNERLYATSGSGTGLRAGIGDLTQG